MGNLKKCPKLGEKRLVDLRFDFPFNSISVIARQWTSDNEMLYAMVFRLRSKTFSPPAGVEPRYAQNCNV